MAEKPRDCRARVSRVLWLNEAVIQVDLAMVEPPEFDFEAGQWVSVRFGKSARVYSMASTPSTRRALTLCADILPDGIGSRWFRSLKEGDEVEFSGPTGFFVFNRADPRRPLFIAEEIGIVPIRSILWDLYQTGFGRPARLFFWGRDRSWLIYDDEFKKLARRYPAFTYIPVVGGGVGASKAELLNAVDQAVASTESLIAYVSGGGEMIKRVREVLMCKGLDRKAIKWEKFW